MNSSKKLLLVVLGILFIAMAARLWYSMRSPPQLPPDAEVFKTVDALFTAVTARNETRLAMCEKRLTTYKERGLLPAAAARRLERVIAMARSGEWQAAAERLYDFMRGQRREGTAATARAKQPAT